MNKKHLKKIIRMIFMVVLKLLKKKKVKLWDLVPRPKMEAQLNLSQKGFLSQNIYRSRLLQYPPPSTQKKFFSDRFRWFEFEWGILRVELQIQFYLVKSRKPKENLIFAKHFETGFMCFKFEGGNKVDENGNLFVLIPCTCKIQLISTNFEQSTSPPLPHLFFP